MKKGGEATRGRPAWWIALIVIVLAVSLYRGLSTTGTAPVQQVPLNEVARLAESGSLEEIIVDGNDLTAVQHSGTRVQSRKEEGVSVVDTLSNLGVSADRIKTIEFTVVGESTGLTVAAIAITLLPNILLVAFFVFLFRSARNATSGPL